MLSVLDFAENCVVFEKGFIRLLQSGWMRFCVCECVCVWKEVCCEVFLALNRIGVNVVSIEY